MYLNPLEYGALTVAAIAVVAGLCSAGVSHFLTYALLHTLQHVMALANAG